MFIIAIFGNGKFPIYLQDHLMEISVVLGLVVFTWGLCDLIRVLSGRFGITEEIVDSNSEVIFNNAQKVGFIFLYTFLSLILIAIMCFSGWLLWLLTASL